MTVPTKLARSLPLATKVLATLFAGLAVAAFPAHAQEINLALPEEGALTSRVIQLVLLVAVLSLAPSILMMVTSFVRIAVVLSLLRTAMGVQQAPPNSVLISLALFLTAFVMAPVLQESYSKGLQPYLADEISTEEAWDLSSGPFRDFMLGQVREDDLKLFLDLSKSATPETPQATPIHILVPAFMISELRRAFEIGFLLFIPFVVIDLVVASVLMSMGMMMLPPIMISLPFKLIFFVLVDGWRLVAGSLVQSFGT